MVDSTPSSNMQNHYNSPKRGTKLLIAKAKMRRYEDTTLTKDPKMGSINKMKACCKSTAKSSNDEWEEEKASRVSSKRNQSPGDQGSRQRKTLCKPKIVALIDRFKN